jgi:hypothetical protein
MITGPVATAWTLRLSATDQGQDLARRANVEDADPKSEPLTVWGQPMTNSIATPILANSLRLAGGFRESELPHLLAALAPLEKHLARWDADQVDLQLSVKDRGGPDQHVTIEAKLGGWPLLVAKTADLDLDRALYEARDELIRQIEDERRRRIPKDNRKLREKPV